ncbi:MAG: hypothetical protein IKN11_00950 [Bacteroidales bacterium]|nr:hypothetical protein [Bacteroidales bacterium]
MTRQQQRIQIIQACLEQQQQLAATAKQEMESAQQQSNDYGANVDRYDSYRTKMMRARDMYAKQLSNANAGIRVLQELINLPPFEKAEHGAIVITDKQKFFLSIGAGKFLVPHRSAESIPQQTFFAISAQTPIYMALKGKQPGDTLTFNGVTQTIVEIL